MQGGADPIFVKYMWSPSKSVDMWGNEGISRLYGISVVAVMNDFGLDGVKGGFL